MVLQFDPIEGALMRRHVGGIGRGARGRGQTQAARSGGAGLRPGTLALQLPFMKVSESMGNHDSEIVDAGSVD
jgi:hypothetical protein